MAFPKASLLATVLAASAAVHGYSWPSPALDRIESMRFDQRGAHAVILAELGSPCSGNNGRPNAADWLRAGFHDMGTRNASAGLGGLDASIRFPEEFTRPENAGDFLVDTVTFFRPFASRLVSLADLVALGAVFALEQCGGPHVDYRAGRVDAKKPSPPGLPGPPDPLNTLTAKFARAGFSQQDMREMVMCGHVIGTVDPHTFPDVFPGIKGTHGIKGGNSNGVPFDSTENHFDQNMMKEYVAGRSTNPLVVSRNHTDRSDLRIFSSDGNATITSMAESLSFFHTKCSNIVQRMIDAVPADVQLTNVITPIPVKPEVKLLRNSDGSFRLFGSVRFWNLDVAGVKDRTVKLLWSGANSNTESITLTKTSVGRTMAPAHETLWYEFPAAGVPISAKTGISKFWFEVTENGKTTVENQGGAGFPLQTDVVLSADSCLSKRGNSADLKITVPKGSSPSHVFVESDFRAPNGDASKATHTATLDKAASGKSTQFDVFTVSLSGKSNKIGDGSFNVGATIGGKQISDWSFFDTSDVDKLNANC